MSESVGSGVFAGLPEVIIAGARSPEGMAGLGLCILVLSISLISVLIKAQERVLLRIVVATICFVILSFSVLAWLEGTNIIDDSKADEKAAATSATDSAVRDTVAVLGQEKSPPVVVPYPADRPLSRFTSYRRTDNNNPQKREPVTIIMAQDLQTTWSFHEAGTNIRAKDTLNGRFGSCSYADKHVEAHVITFMAVMTNRKGGVTIACQYDVEAAMYQHAGQSSGVKRNSGTSPAP